MKTQTTGTHEKTASRSILRKALLLLNLAALLLLFFIVVLPAGAQGLPGFLEGPLSHVNVAERTVRVNGVLMHIPLGTPMSSPTVDLNALAVAMGIDPIELLEGELLPGRATPGFTGGTCLCATDIDPLSGIVMATSMVLEPSENVILATVTTHHCVTPSCDPDEDPLNELRVGGVLMNPSRDVRLLSEHTTNRGFEVNLMLGNLVGVGAGAEGYLGNTGDLHLYVLEVDGGVLMNEGITEVSILRARCRPRGDAGDWSILGATHDPGTGTVTLRRSDTGAVLGTASVIADAADPAFGAYLFSDEVIGSCTDSIIADFGTVSTTSGVDVRGGAVALPLAPAPTDLLPRPATNTPPVAVGDLLSTSVNVELTFGGLFLLGNDTDADVDDILSLISVAATSTGGGIIADNLDGTFTYIPAPGFSGLDTFSYTITDGFIAPVIGSVKVTVETPLVDHLIVQKAFFVGGKNEWRVRGTSSIVGPGNTITIYLGSTVGGQILGIFPVDALGDWEFRTKNAQVLPGLETTISVISTSGGIIEGVPLSIK